MRRLVQLITTAGFALINLAAVRTEEEAGVAAASSPTVAPSFSAATVSHKPFAKSLLKGMEGRVPYTYAGDIVKDLPRDILIFFATYVKTRLEACAYCMYNGQNKIVAT